MSVADQSRKASAHTEEDVLVDYGLLGQAAEVAGFRRTRGRNLLFYACPGEIDIEKK